MDEQERISEAESTSNPSAPEEELKQIADEAARYVPVDAIHEIATTEPVILLFDEADALFGKRSTVKDSHDKYGES